MNIRLEDLTPLQIRTLTRLDDGQPHEDSVGLELAQMRAVEVAACLQLLVRDLVCDQIGWRDTLWFRLTPDGRRLRMSRPA